MELFDGRTIVIDLQKVVERGENNYTWFGKVRGVPGGEVILTMVDGYLTGQIHVSDKNAQKIGVYGVESASGNLYAISELDFSAMEDEPNVPVPDSSGDISGTALTSGALPQGDTATSIDVMVVYSNQTALTAGAAINSQIQAAIDSANAAYANSGLSQRLNLVHATQINYNESGDFNVMLNDVTSGRNGAETVPSLRDTYRADLVSLFVESGSYCGMAWVGPSASYGFSVVNRGCATGNLSFAHELGHNMGLLHDPAVDPGTSPYAYGHGYVDPACKFRTVMAYPNCGSPRVTYFSNPNVIYPGTLSPMGTTQTSDAARVLNTVGNTVANFKLSTGSVCAHTNPSITISPTTQSGSGGQSLTYQVTVTNNDTSDCSGSTFAVTPTVPAGYTQLPSTLSLALAPGARSTQSIVITSPVSSPVGTYSFTESVTNTTAPGSTASANASYVIPPLDITPPVLSITNPTQGAILPKKGSGKINIQASASDASGIARITISIDGTQVKTCSLVTSCAYSWSYSRASSGAHTILVTATDRSTKANQASTTISVTK